MALSADREVRHAVPVDVAQRRQPRAELVALIDVAEERPGHGADLAVLPDAAVAPQEEDPRGAGIIAEPVVVTMGTDH